MTLAPDSMTGRSCLRYTISVTTVLRCPTRREISSMGTPLSDRSDTNECRSSRGVHSLASTPRAWAMAARKSRRTSAESNGVP
jgi:hypothetical protein